ncbi:MAG TPA: DUF3238 domain-containing protein [Chthonomonadaceae bacterium]|nr:DUF3238 domain-containing protein [Chthonomonadaceae bacterium]
MDLESVTFWLNAFIPNSVCQQKGELFVITIPAPQGLPVPAPRFFTGDQREFSDDPNASARMHSEVKIEGLSSDTPRIAFQNNLCGESHEVDEQGNIIASATAPSDRMMFLNLRGSQTVDPNGGVIDGIPGSVQIDVVGSANLPLVGLTPDIDYSGTLIIDRAEGNLLWKGAVSGFPAFEMYVRVNDGPVGTLAQFNPISPIELLGEENRPVDAAVRIQL